jgi:Ca2+-binding EF-hand superfamily protein
MRWLSHVLAGWVVLALSGTVLAQYPGMGGPFGGWGGPGGAWGGPGGSWGGPGGASGGRGRRGGMRSSGGPDGRSQFLERMIQQFDANGDGIITPEELGDRRAFFERFARRLNLDLTKPIPVTTLREALANRAAQRSPGTPTTAGGSPGTSASGSKGGASGNTADAAKSGPSLVPGFGVASSLPPVPGFGTPLVLASSASSSVSSSPSQAASGGASSPASTAASSSSGSSSSPSPGSGQADSRVRQYAESLLKKYDKNNNGTLDKDEWEQIQGSWRGSWSDADRNGDGAISPDELTAQLLHSNPQGSASSSSATAKVPSQGKSYRFLSPQERLPKGLPDWFIEKDADGDGQVTMAEYATLWSAAKAEEFARYDLNGDGVITPAECLKARSSK